jgi:hypothetical protein
VRVTLYKNATLTFAQENNIKKWVFEKVVTFSLVSGDCLIGRSCSSSNHPFHLHIPHFSTLIHWESCTEIDTFPYAYEVEQWFMSPFGQIGSKEREKKHLEEKINTWFQKLT